MSAIVAAGGAVRQLDGKADPNREISLDEVTDPERLSRFLESLLRDVASAKRRWWPRAIDHEDRAVDATGTTKYRFPHGFGGRVRWWPVDWSGASASPGLVRHADSDGDTLVLVSHVAGTVTLRIEEAG